MVFVYTFLSNILNCTHHYLLASSFIPARLILRISLVDAKDKYL